MALALLLSFFGYLSAQPALAVSLSLVVTPAHPRTADPAYPGAGSTVTTATDAQTGLTFTVAGRHYGVDPADGRPRWGLRTGTAPGNGNNQGFIITNGFTPAAAGARTDRTGNGASYVSVTVGNVRPGTLFQDLTIDFDGLVFTRSTNAWAAASTGDFANWSLARQTNANANGRQLSVTLPSFTWTGGPPLELRIYGITGTDEGAFANLRLSGLLVSPAVPEPGPVTLGILALAWCLRRRR